MGTLPLQGTRVLDLGRLIAAPIAAQVMGDLGAQVIKIESPEGEPLRGVGGPVAPVIEGSRYLRTDGYPINSGSSFVMALEFTDDGPRAMALLTYSQSGDPDSPHFTAGRVRHVAPPSPLCEISTPR